MGRNTGCPGGTDVGTRRGTARKTDALRCWVQNQNQNQRFWLLSSCGCSTHSLHPSNGDLAPTHRAAGDSQTASTSRPFMDEKHFGGEQ